MPLEIQYSERDREWLQRFTACARSGEEANVNGLKSEDESLCTKLAEKADMVFDYDSRLKYGRLRKEKPFPLRD